MYMDHIKLFVKSEKKDLETQIQAVRIYSQGIIMKRRNDTWLKEWNYKIKKTLELSEKRKRINTFKYRKLTHQTSGNVRKN